MVQVMWALCVYLEAVSVLPQLRMMQNAKVPRPARSSSCRAHSAQTAAVPTQKLFLVCMASDSLPSHCKLCISCGFESAANCWASCRWDTVSASSLSLPAVTACSRRFPSRHSALFDRLEAHLCLPCTMLLVCLLKCQKHKGLKSNLTYPKEYRDGVGGAVTDGLHLAEPAGSGEVHSALRVCAGPVAIHQLRPLGAPDN